MSEEKQKSAVLSELQQLRGIVLGEYTTEVDERLANLEKKLQVTRADLVNAIEDSNKLSANEIQAVRDLIDDRLAALTAGVNQQFAAIQAQLDLLHANHVDRTQLGELLVAMGKQIKL